MMAPSSNCVVQIILLCTMVVQSAMSMPTNTEADGVMIPTNQSLGHPRFEDMYQPGFFEGDIAIGGLGLATDENGTITYAGIVPDRFYSYWPSGVLYYEFHSSLIPFDRTLIQSVMTEMTQRTGGCVRFVNRNRNPAIRNFVIIRSDMRGCYVDHVGRFIPGIQQLNLQARVCMTRGTVIHELMHSLGFHHEQSRPDRDRFVRILLQNLSDPRDRNLIFQFQARSRDNTFGTPYDIRSVMHYPLNAFAQRGKLTILPIGIYANINPREVGNRNFMGPQDIAIIRRAYRCGG